MPSYLTPGVYVEEVDRGSKPLAAVGTSTAAFVGFTARAPNDDPADPDGLKPRMVTNWAQYEKLYGGFAKGAMLPHAVYGFFNNGGGNCYIVRIPHKTTPRLALGAPSDGEKPALSVSALTEEEGLEVVIEASETEGAFDVKVVKGDEELESFPGVTLGPGGKNVQAVVNDGSRYVSVLVDSAVAEEIDVIAPGTFPLAVPEARTVNAADFEGGAASRHGIQGLVIADDVTMLAVPDLINIARTADGVNLGLWKQVQTSMIAHCEAEGNRMAILDPPPDLSPQKVKEWRQDAGEEGGGYDSKFAVMYYPWIKVTNPLNGSIAVPPSGHMAGIWARNDETRGVWKAPANEVVTGALDVVNDITKGEQGTLNPIGVNCIRPFGTRGIRVWGARTLSSDPSWNYVNVRRLFNMIESSIMDGTQWVVFEPNDQALWQRVKRTISSFLIGLWRDGALFGATPEEAYYVKCDAETNPQDSIDLGRLIVEVGISPVKPAEFVIFRISQWAGGADSAE